MLQSSTHVILNMVFTNIIASPVPSYLPVLLSVLLFCKSCVVYMISLIALLAASIAELGIKTASRPSGLEACFVPSLLLMVNMLQVFQNSD